MADMGLLGGIAEGLNQGLKGYRETKQSNEELALKRRQQQLANQANQLQISEKGYQQSPENPDQLVPTALKSQQMQLQADELDPNSDASRKAREATRGLLRQAAPGFEKSIPDDMSAAEIKEQAKEGLLGKSISGVYGMQGRQLTSDRVADRTSVMREGLEERRNVNSSNAGQAFEKDPILINTKKTTNSLDRAQSLLDGNEPINAKSFNVLQQDFINAMAPGGAATEGKVNRELVETAQSKLNELKLRFGDVEDLRAAQPEVVSNLRNLIAQVRKDYKNSVAEQAANIHDSYAESSNPKVKQTIKTKLKKYSPEAYAEKYGDEGTPAKAGPASLLTGKSQEDLQALQWAQQNKADPRAAAILKANGM